MSSSGSFVEITHGLANSNKVFTTVALDEVKEYLTRHKDCYERTCDEGMNRVYVDFDGEAIVKTQQDFDELVQNIGTSITFGIEEEHNLMNASHYMFGTEKKNKLSFRLTLTKKHGSKEAVKEYVINTLFPQLKDILSEVIPFTLDKERDDTESYLGIDTSVYAKGRKMRMWNSSKDKKGVSENRPNILWDESSDVKYTLITYIPSDSEALPEPIKEIPKIKPSVALGGAGTSEIEEDDEEDDGSDIFKKILFGLSPKRVEEYDDWLRIGFICFNEEQKMDLWESWTKAMYPRYKNGSKRSCSDKWRTFKKGNMTVASLWKWLKEDNQTLYNELVKDRNDFWLLVKNANHAETAKFFYNIKPLSYLYNESMKWFQLQPSCVWKRYEGVPSGLMSDIWATLKDVVKEHQMFIDFTSTDEKHKERLKQLSAFAKNIGTRSFVEGVIAFLPANYNDADLPKKMDENRNLFAFADKVVELDTNIVRDIRATDYISLHAGYKYPTSSNPSVRDEINDVLTSIWENGEVVEYVMKVIASNLNGRKKWEEFYVWTGRGGNGKGLISEIVKRAYGDYFHSIPHECLTKRSDKKDAPNPPIANAKGKRYVQAQEPEADDKLQIGAIKELTGGDTITARALYKDPVTFVPQFGLFLQCNTIPKLNKLDGGIKRRMVVINFPFQFVEHPTESHHRPINTDLKDKIAKSEEWRDEFMLMLLETYRTIGIMEKPAFIKDSTDEYIAENDAIRDWLVTNYNKSKDSTDKKYRISSEDLRKTFLDETKMNPAEMSAAKFKSLMEMNGVIYSHFAHAFKGAEWDEDAETYVEVDRKAGRYFTGIERIRYE